MHISARKIKEHPNLTLRRSQRLWLILIMGVSVLHFVRDILQELGIKYWISTVLVKPPIAERSLIWHPYNTLIIELFLIICSLIILKRERFGRLGWLTVFVVIVTGAAWVYYWYFV